MADEASPQATSKADLRLGYRERLTKALSEIESANSRTLRPLFKRLSIGATQSPSGLEKTGNELVECINPKALRLQASIESNISLSANTIQQIDAFLGVLEESIEAVKASMSGLHVTGKSIEKTMRRCQQNIETAWKDLSSSLPPSTAPPGALNVQPAEGPAKQVHLERPTDPSPFAEYSKSNSDDLREKDDLDAQEDVIEDSLGDKIGWTKLLGPARTIFKYVGAVTPLIPMVGSFVQCGVDVGNAIIDMLDGTAQNAEAIKRLSKRVNRLSSMMDIFKDEKRSYCRTEPGLLYLKEFQRICGPEGPVWTAIQKLRSQNPAGKLVFSDDNAGTIENLNEKIDDALEQLDLYLRLNANRLLSDLVEARLIAVLGDGDCGNTGYKEEDGFCQEGTREEVLQGLDTWANDASSSKVLLLKGQAGRGKSTIVKTAARRYVTRPRKATSSAIFFFHRGKDAGNSRIMLALALQLVHHGDPRVREAILQAVKAQPGVASSPPEEQFRVLLVEPLKELKIDPPAVLLVIDALDECGQEEHSSLLKIIAKHSPSLPSTVKILITSRPERNVESRFKRLVENGRTEDLDAVHTSIIEKDLRAFFEARLLAIGQEYGLDFGWEGAGTIERLVGMAQGLFQWASTAMEYIVSAPKSRLQRLLQSETTVIGTLPALYWKILKEAFEEDSVISDELIQHVIGSLAVAPGPLSLTTLVYLWVEPSDARQPVDTFSDIRDEILNHLRSLIMVPESPNDPIQFSHTSVRDFLVNEKQCGDYRFFVDTEQHHRRLATVCLERLKRDMTNFDVRAICGPDDTSAGVRNTFREKGFTGVVYCARSWSAHLSRVPYDAAYLGLLDEFCRMNLIHWMEILSLAEVAQEIIPMTQQGKDWVGDNETSPTTYELLDDAQRLCHQSFRTIATRPYHISRSVLLHCPWMTALRQCYNPASDIPAIIRGPVGNKWPNTLWTSSIGVYNIVSALAFSPDGKIIASGSSDGIVQLWNAENGTQAGPLLTGHTKTVNGLTFSGDSKIVASGSADGTIRLWHVESATGIGEAFTGHTDAINSVAFSRVGETLASGSNDHTIRLWSVDQKGTQTREPEILSGHTNKVNSVVFSGNGQTIASGSGDGTIRLWSTESKTMIGEAFTGHTHDVNSVAFSCDDRTIVSGSDDGTIRLWSVESWQQIGGVLNGERGGPVTKVSFRDGKTVVSLAPHISMRVSGRLGLLDDGKALKLFQDVAFNGLYQAWQNLPIEEVLKTIPLGPAGSDSDSDYRSRKRAGEALNQFRRFFESLEPARHGDRNGEALRRAWDRFQDFLGCPLPSENVRNAMGSTGFGYVSIRLWNSEGGSRNGETLTGHTSSISTMTLSPDGNTIASGSLEGKIGLQNVKFATKAAAPLTGHSMGSVNSVAFSHNRRMIASGSDDGTIQLWDAKTGARMWKPLTGHGAKVTSVVFSHNGQTIASGSDDHTVRLWSLKPNGPHIGEALNGHTKKVNSVAFSRDGTIVVSGSDDHTVRLWDTKTWRRMGVPLTGHTKAVNSVAFSRNGKDIASASDDGTVRLWSVGKNGKQTGDSEVLSGHTDKVKGVAFSRDGGILSSWSSDNVILHWDVKSGAQIEKVDPDDAPHLSSFQRLHGQQVILHGSESGDDLAGWVFHGKTRLFWLPREWYYDKVDERLKLSIDGNTLVICHRDIHILDISPIISPSDLSAPVQPPPRKWIKKLLRPWWSWKIAFLLFGVITLLLDIIAGWKGARTQMLQSKNKAKTPRKRKVAHKTKRYY